MKRPLLIVILLINIGSAYAQPSAAEYNALMELYSSTNGANWTNNTGWSTANPSVVQSVAGWHGVSVDSQGKVIGLDLRQNNLTGSLPATIGNLSELKELILFGNTLTGSIPGTIGSLSNLENLTLTSNALSGTIPSEIGSLSNLLYLSLDDNDLSGSIPSSITTLSNLTDLSLGFNQLSGEIPSSIGNLTNLIGFDAAHNNLTGSIPTSIGNLTGLYSLNLLENNLTGNIPTTIGNLVNLRLLWLGSNDLSGSIPAEVGNLSALVYLYLYSNNLSGTIPSSIGNLTQLIELKTSFNALTGEVPSSIGSLSSLQYLDLRVNDLSGAIPSSINNLNALRELELNSNELTGSIPSLSNLVSLKKLTLNSNGLTGSIPSSLSNLQNLEYLALGNNQLTGSIPSELGTLTNLKRLELYFNPLEGTLPVSLGNLIHLEHLSLSNINLSGSIPPEFGQLTNLKILNLSGCNLSGTLPPELGNLIYLEDLHLDRNQLSGSIPDTYASLLNLRSLDLHQNQLTGTLPLWIANFSNLTNLYLYENNFTGGIPPEYGVLNKLSNVGLQSNHLSGPIPVDWGSISGFQYLNVRSNNFSFSDFLELKQAFSGNFYYSPQNAVDSEKTVLAQVGSPLTLVAQIDRNTFPSSKYQWFKQLTPSSPPIAINEVSTTGHTITIPSVSQDDIGALYSYKIYNDAASDIVLTSHPQTIALDVMGACASTLSEEFFALMDLYAATNGSGWLNNTGWKDVNPNVPQVIDGWYGIRTDANGHVTDIDLDGAADWTTITNSEGYQVYTGNNLIGMIPASIGKLKCLKVLNVGGNQLTGPLPNEIGQLTNLVWLVGSTNQFTGNIPSSIGNLTKLDRILMEKNQLTGEIPPSIGNLPELWALLLNDNQLSGPIPATLGNLKKLRFFYLYNNQLTGSIPDEIGTMALAYRIGFHNNQLTGTIPPSLANLANLQLLYLSNNNLEGLVPPGLSNIPSLTTFVFDNNKFTFSNFLDIKNTFTGGTLTYSPQALIDEEKTTEGTVGESITLSTNIDRYTTPQSVYQWFKSVNGNTVSLTSPSVDAYSYTIPVLTEADGAATYYYTITNPAAPSLVLTSRTQHLSLNPAITSFDVNYLRTTDVTVKGKMTLDDVEDATPDERLINYTYFDGLGRPIQQVAQQSSPLQRDVITPIVYDQFGREPRKYLPFVSGTNGGYRRNSEIIDQNHNYDDVAHSFYAQNSDNKVADDSRPYSEIFFEPSPLKRIDKEHGPGVAWAPSSAGGNDKFIAHQYLSNVHSLSGSPHSEAIIAWRVDESGIPVKEDPVENYIAQGGYYESNQLFIKVTLDEHQNAVREYTNKQGQLILKKVQAVAQANPLDINLNDIDEWACTYYVYDNLGNLRYVLPPEGVKQYLEVTSQN